MQAIAFRFASTSVYALFVISNFLFIYFCPDNKVDLFLSAYALSSMVFSFFGTSIYAGLKNRKLDYVIAGASFTALIAVISGQFGAPLSGIVLYTCTAGLLVLAEFSVAQAQKPIFLTLQRLGTAMSALVLTYDFNWALLARSIWLLVCLIASVFFKQYESTDRQQKLVDSARAYYSIITCVLYFGGLAMLPHLLAQNVKETYIIFAVVGNIVLKLQDYHLKQFILRQAYYPIPAEFIAVAGSIFALSVAAYAIDYRVMLLVPFAIGLAFSGRILKYARWG